MSEKQYNPRDRIKNHLKRKSTSSRNVNSPAAAAPAVSFEGLDREINAESCPVPANPFKIASPQKKRRNQVTFYEETENAQDSFGASFLNATEQPKTPTKALRTSPRKRKTPQFSRIKSFDPSLLQEFHAAVDFSQLLPTSSSTDSLPNKIPQETSTEMPIDSRLGSKLRLVSKVPLPWMNTRKSTGIVAVRIPAIERYEALKFYNQLYISGQEDTSTNLPTTPLSLLEASSLYYQFPVVPGMTLYPRITSELKTVQRIPLPPPCTDKMFNQWVECFEQLFMSYKKGERDHFYVASAVFNVLFTKTTASDEQEDADVLRDEASQSCFRSFKGQQLVALVSHTTSSTREHLRKQGVDYEVIGAKPNIKRTSSTCLFGQNTSTMDCLMSGDSRENSRLGAASEGITSAAEAEKWILGEDEKNNTKGSDISSEDENESPTKANADWLKEVGVSPRQVKGVSNVRRQLSSQFSDREGISSLIVRGTAVQSLYNTLMSSDIVHEKTGPYTKIPPTLIAVSPFLYGQLLSLSKSSQIISKAGSKCPEYVLELDGGPILPHCTKMLLNFIRSAQICRSAEDKTVQVQVQDRHASQGMSDWTTRTTNWNSVTVHDDCVKWTKKE